MWKNNPRQGAGIEASADHQDHQHFEPVTQSPFTMSEPPPPPTPIQVRKTTPKWVRILTGIVAIISLAITGLIWLGHKSMMGTKYAVTEKEAVNYSGSATVQDAKVLGEDLKKWGYFDNSKTKDVLLHTDQSGTVISFVLGRSWDDAEIVTAFKQVGGTFAEDLKVNHLKIRLIDDHLNTKNEIPIN
jgi:hypothetical protein